MDLYLWLSYRFMDLFPNAPMVREAQKELDELIQQGVFQITRLLKNSEASANQDIDSYTKERSASSFKGKIYTNTIVHVNYTVIHFYGFYVFSDIRRGGIGRGRLTDRLLAQGLLTPAMLTELRNEWDRQSEPLPAHHRKDPPPLSNTRPPRRKRKP